jgi:hydroxyacylglutathione hydrolase
MNLIPLPALSDNYIWMLHDGRHALVVDPGEPGPVVGMLEALGLQLASILVTHHHADHVGGVDALRDATGAAVHGPARESIPQPAAPVAEGDVVRALGLDFAVLDVPGHTAGHIAYWCADAGGAPLLFSGDTLFSGGCGRLFEGSPAQMLDSLDKLSRLPKDTRICCGHEYTLGNLRFARAVEPDNLDVLHYTAQCEARRQQGQPTLPSTIALEHRVNPFLRSRLPGILDAVRAHAAAADSAAAGADAGAAAHRDEVQAFACLRQWKNDFR